ncbi:hypothetical protein PCANC_08573 [Puccinia coronata f. sp. avenae]|uniref:Core domain-containing protein n=1 Tax=Puccinia coronata f. sp. avenae TaxID=200324 RepID=A0A2N5V1V9_9BASI|nr:hypothetical protein PCANC_20828 [Puccinia coronata f. sp. avenae]PLW43992.1 hypothetical protein PCANC_08573 [Puccinia coronata f. sp. avenae]
MSTSKLITIAARPIIPPSSFIRSGHQFNSMRLLTPSSPLSLNRPDPGREKITRKAWKNSLRSLHQDVTSTQAPGSSIQPPSQTSSNPEPSYANLISTPTRSSNDDPSSPSPAKPLGLKISPSVIEQIERVRKMDNKPNEVLRLSVESGGCHGFQYKIAFTESIEEDDFVFTVGNRNGLVVVDEGSLGLMDGSTIEFATELIGSSFRILDNPHSAGKGCGCGVNSFFSCPARLHLPPHYPYSTAPRWSLKGYEPSNTV